MVSKARVDFPEPEMPVITTSLSRGISTSMHFRLCSHAPLMMILSIAMVSLCGRYFPVLFRAGTNADYSTQLLFLTRFD
jgi:hypothetical protein